MRLIDADALCEECCGSIIKCVGIGCRVPTMQTLDADLVRHGRWELHGNDDTLGCSYFCSLCGANYDEEWFEENMPFRYCPKCGAKMDLEDA